MRKKKPSLKPKIPHTINWVKMGHRFNGVFILVCGIGNWHDQGKGLTITSKKQNHQHWQNENYGHIQVVQCSVHFIKQQRVRSHVVGRLVWPTKAMTQTKSLENQQINFSRLTFLHNFLLNILVEKGEKMLRSLSDVFNWKIKLSAILYFYHGWFVGGQQNVFNDSNLLVYCSKLVSQ